MVYSALLLLCAWERAGRAERRGPSALLPPRLRFTLLVPARHKEKVIAQAIRRMVRIDYPPELTEVIIVCEVKDRETIREAYEGVRSLSPAASARFTVTTFSDGPIDKPHHLNAALRIATGDVIGVLDAEDDIQLGILRTVNTILLQEPVDVVQGAVQPVHHESAWFSALNCAERFLWFNSRLHHDVFAGELPLAGNTLFVWRSKLVNVGGWDGECPTEDVDLGSRLSAMGATLKVFSNPDLATREETPLTVAALVRQRTRWYGGFLQVLKKGDWLKMHSLKAKLLALHMLTQPFTASLASLLWLPAGLMVFLGKVTMPIPVVTFLPLYALFFYVSTQIVGYWQFTEEFGLRFRFSRAVLMAVAFPPYSWLAAFASLRAIIRELCGTKGRETTEHAISHRTPPPVCALGEKQGSVRHSRGNGNKPLPNGPYQRASHHPSDGAEQENSDYYKILRVHPDADAAVIEGAYAFLARRRPNGGGGRTPLELVEDAAWTLLDPERRRTYDARLAVGAPALVYAGAAGIGPVAAPTALPLPHPLVPARAPPGAVSPFDALREGRLEDDLSARRVLTTGQKLAGLCLLLVIGTGLLASLRQTSIDLVAATTTVYAAAIVFKALLAVLSLSGPSETSVDPEAIAALDDDDLPVYTLLLPLCREGEVLGALLRSIEELDYPKDKLDVKLLLEGDDQETMTSLAGLDLPPYIEVLVVPNVGPKGKPRACNYGLRFARGSYVVLYDAEDRPERDQLKKALVAFARDDIACVQAKLNFYNRDQNLLTKWFTSEYSTWFDLYLPALSRLRLPIPLGGTSNHFPIRFLRAVGAWDPYNVTEDADLGVRLARRQLRTAVIDSVTYEEANSHLGNWLRQRSRWLKGYIQTWLVHMRHPLELHSELGPVGFLAFQAMVFGTFFTCLVNPVLWFLVLAWYTTHAGIIQALYPGPILYVSAVAFFGGNFLFVFVSILGSLQRGFYHGVKYALASHVYWALMSVAAFKALHQLLVKPYYWEKTRHGLDTLSVVPGLSGRP